MPKSKICRFFAMQLQMLTLSKNSSKEPTSVQYFLPVSRIIRIYQSTLPTRQSVKKKKLRLLNRYTLRLPRNLMVYRRSEDPSTLFVSARNVATLNAIGVNRFVSPRKQYRQRRTKRGDFRGGSAARTAGRKIDPSAALFLAGFACPPDNIRGTPISGDRVSRRYVQYVYMCINIVVYLFVSLSLSISLYRPFHTVRARTRTFDAGRIFGAVDFSSTGSRRRHTVRECVIQTDRPTRAFSVMFPRTTAVDARRPRRNRIQSLGPFFPTHQRRGPRPFTARGAKTMGTHCARTTGTNGFRGQRGPCETASSRPVGSVLADGGGPVPLRTPAIRPSVPSLLPACRPSADAQEEDSVFRRFKS